MRTRSSSVIHSSPPPPPRRKHAASEARHATDATDATSSPLSAKPTKYRQPTKLLKRKHTPIPARQVRGGLQSSTSLAVAPPSVKKSKTSLGKELQKPLKPPKPSSSKSPEERVASGTDGASLYEFPARLDSDAPLYFEFLKQHDIIAGTLTKNALPTEKGMRNPTHNKKRENAFYEIMHAVYSARPAMSHFFDPSVKIIFSNGKPLPARKVIVDRAAGWWKREKLWYKKAREQLGETSQGLASPADLETINDPEVRAKYTTVIASYASYWDMLQLCGQGNPHLGESKTSDLTSDETSLALSARALGTPRAATLDKDKGHINADANDGVSDGGSSTSTFATADWPYSAEEEEGDLGDEDENEDAEEADNDMGDVHLATNAQFKSRSTSRGRSLTAPSAETGAKDLSSMLEDEDDVDSDHTVTKRSGRGTKRARDHDYSDLRPRHSQQTPATQSRSQWSEPVQSQGDYMLAKARIAEARAARDAERRAIRDRAQAAKDEEARRSARDKRHITRSTFYFEKVCNWPKERQAKERQAQFRFHTDVDRFLGGEEDYSIARAQE